MTLRRFWTLVDEMARMSLRADASRFYFRYFWWILEPLLYVAVFYIVFDVLLGPGRPDFLAFLMCGKLTFVWFSKSVVHASRSIVDSKGLIGQIDLPKALFPLAVVQEGLYRQAAVFVLLMLFLVVQGYAVTGAWLWLLPVALVNYLLIVGASLAGAYLVCLVFDFSLLISLAMIFLLFISGIFWDVRTLPDPAMADWVACAEPPGVSYRYLPSGAYAGSCARCDAPRGRWRRRRGADRGAACPDEPHRPVPGVEGHYVVNTLGVDERRGDWPAGNSEAEVMLELREVSHVYHARKANFDYGIHKVLDGVSLTLRRGETLGVLGKNGAGKTTLLRLMAGILAPTRGDIRRVAGATYSLLTLGLGFQPQLTGRDNARLSALLQGATQEEAEACLESVKAFSELGASFDEPVKTYSSGMLSRLGFSTALQTRVDVLLIDEVLSVGDRGFREKSAQAMRERVVGEQTVVLVSHLESQIEEVCDWAVWIDGGVARCLGPVDQVLHEYRQGVARP